MRSFYVLLFLVFLANATVPVKGQITVPQNHINKRLGNPWFNYNGQPSLLMGNNIGAFNSHKKALQRAIEIKNQGANFIRIGLMPTQPEAVYPFMKNKASRFDLEKPNQAFYENLRWFLDRMRNNQIIVQLVLWSQDAYTDTAWATNPFNPANCDLPNLETQRAQYDTNVTAVTAFYQSVPLLQNHKKLLKLQQNYLEHLLQVTQNYPNILYAIDARPVGLEEWPIYWSNFIKKTTKQPNNTPPLVSVLWQPYNLNAPNHLATLRYHTNFDYADAAPANLFAGHQQHFQHTIYTQLMRQSPSYRPVIASDAGPNPTNTTHAWQQYFAGLAGIAHQPTQANQPGFFNAVTTFNKVFDYFASVTDSSFIKHHHKRICTRRAGNQFAIYFPQGGRAFIHLPSINSTLRWFNTKTANWEPPQLNRLNQVLIKAPAPQYIAYIELSPSP